MKNIFFIIISSLVILYIFISIRKNKLDIRQSFIWTIFCVIILFFSIWPKSIDWLAKFFGISYAPALFLTIAVVILFIMNFIQSKKIVELQKKVVDLGQELSIVKENNNEKRK